MNAGIFPRAVEVYEVLLVLGVALGASVLTFFSGFGLGTLLLPAFALVFPLDVAVAASAVVHLANNLWKGVLVGRLAEWRIVLRFGVPAAVAALTGAGLFLLLEGEALWIYHLAGRRTVTALGLVVGALITVFALFELVPVLKAWSVHRRHLVLGGLLSGFFGGLSGHQGALRSVFLTKVGLHAKAFVATGTLCAILVDVGRLAVYSTRYTTNAAAIDDAGGWFLLGGAVLMALVGAVVGAKLLGKTTMEGIHLLVGVLLLVLGPLIAMGLV